MAYLIENDLERIKRSANEKYHNSE